MFKNLLASLLALAAVCIVVIPPLLVLFPFALLYAVGFAFVWSASVLFLFACFLLEAMRSFVRVRMLKPASIPISPPLSARR